MGGRGWAEAIGQGEAMSRGEAVGWGQAALTDLGGDGVAEELAQRAIEVRDADALDTVVLASILADHCRESGGQGAPWGAPRCRGPTRRARGGWGRGAAMEAWEEGRRREEGERREDRKDMEADLEEQWWSFGWWWLLGWWG